MNRLCWKIGSGVNVSIFYHCWIPNSNQFRINKTVRNCHLKLVAELINMDQRLWKRELITSVFTEEEAALILQVRLSIEPHEDVVCWRGEASGGYSVRSAYM